MDRCYHTMYSRKPSSKGSSQPGGQLLLVCSEPRCVRSHVRSHEIGAVSSMFLYSYYYHSYGRTGARQGALAMDSSQHAMYSRKPNSKGFISTRMTAASCMFRTQMRALACARSRHGPCQQHASCTRITATRTVARGPDKGQWQWTANTPCTHEK